MTTRRAAAAVTATTVAALLAGAALATVRGSTQVNAAIHGCVKENGTLRVVAAPTACKKSERGLSWNAQGAKGDTGAAGPQGAAGPRGATGAQGPPGPGLVALEDLNGVACQPGGAGTIALTYDDARRAVLTCVTQTESPAVRVNEFMTGTTTGAADEFIELYNAGTATAHVGGWKVVYRSASGTSDTTLVTIPSGTSIAPGGFYLVGGSAYNGGVAPDQSFATSIAASGGGIALRDAGGTVVDSVGYGTATNAFVEDSPAVAPPVTAPPGSSSIRLPDGHDTNDNEADFSVGSTPTPRAPNA